MLKNIRKSTISLIYFNKIGSNFKVSRLVYKTSFCKKIYPDSVTDFPPTDWVSIPLLKSKMKLWRDAVFVIRKKNFRLISGENLFVRICTYLFLYVLDIAKILISRSTIFNICS